MSIEKYCLQVNQAVKICLVKFDAKQCLVYYHAFLDIQPKKREI